MSKILSAFKKNKGQIFNIIIVILCLIIIYESLFVEIRYWRAAIFGGLLILKIVELTHFWKNNQNSNN